MPREGTIVACPAPRQVQPTAPTEVLEGGAAEIRPEASGNFQLIIKGVASGLYASRARARNAIGIYQRMGLVS